MWKLVQAAGLASTYFVVAFLAPAQVKTAPDVPKGTLRTQAPEAPQDTPRRPRQIQQPQQQQQPAPPPPVFVPQLQPQLQPQQPVQQAQQVQAENQDKWCDIYISDDDNRNMLVVDQDGHYMTSVRQATMTLQFGMKKPSVKLLMWNGIYRPSDTSQIHEEDWSVRNLRTVSVQEFQKLVDSGQ